TETVRVLFRELRAHGRPCCVAVTNLDMSAEVVGETYRQQAATPPCVKAIIFNTEHGPLFMLKETHTRTHTRTHTHTHTHEKYL
uniref:Uncharacterized protein n=1 Tax=Oreochromis aureus TaxID=47969 RepID=A0AAZ1XGW9_OREAU